MSSEGIDPTRVLVVDDNIEGQSALSDLLNSNGYIADGASNGECALQKLREFSPDVVLLDVQMPGIDGFEVTRIIKSDKEYRYTIVILLTGKDSLEDVVYGLEQGADDYIKKPYKSEELLARMRAAVRLKRTYAELRLQEKKIQEFRKREQSNVGFDNIIGQSSNMREIFDLISKVAPADVSVLVTGESGTGKELVASAVHYHSPRKDKMFVALNCSAFNENLLESELFGHAKGAFTGAVRDKEGLFEVADGGTLFLDELGEMPPSLQVKLLRVLQEGTFMPVGGTKQKKVDVRVVAATNRNVRQMVEDGTFREDLFYRLNVVNIHIPPLRERREDIPLLVDFFFKQLAKKKGTVPKSLLPESLSIFASYLWPGNIRELQNEIERLVIMSGDIQSIGLDLLSNHIKKSASDGVLSEKIVGTLKNATDALEKEMILNTLERLEWNKSEAAKQLGISRSNLIAKVQSYGIDK